MRAVRRESLPILIVKEIKNDIEKGLFKPGDKIPTESELCNLLKIGRPTLREALNYLCGQKVIEKKYGAKGYYVSLNQILNLKKEMILELLEKEIVQLEEEGRDISEQIKKSVENLRKKDSIEDIELLYDELDNSRQRDDFPYEEPSDIREIMKNFPNPKITILKEKQNKEILIDHLYGAWLGRCIGCILGKPVEGWTKQQIELYLERTNAYPLDNYIPFQPNKLKSEDQPFQPFVRESTLGGINFVCQDDDLDYTILNMKVIKENGFNFYPEDIGEMWISNLPYKQVFTAERQAYQNIVNNFKPPVTATYRNPFREFIGAQIRADIFGYVSPGNPELAAYLAYKDASISHVKNGIYGEMFIAALIAVAFISDDLEEMIKTALSLIPKKSRLQEMVENVLTWSKEKNSWQEVWEMVNKKFGKYNWVHVLPNLAFVLLGLIWGEYDFSKTISIAVMCGHDTDCNGATAGSVLGAMKGKNALEEKFISPLNDRIKSNIFEYSDVRISDLARETLELIGKSDQKTINIL